VHFQTEYAVWQELSENLSNLSSLYRSEPFYGSFQKYLRSVYTNQLTKLGWEAAIDESQRTGTLRGTVIQMLCVAGHMDVCKEALSRFKLFVESPEQNPIPGDLRSIVYRAAMRQDEAYVFDKLKELYEASSFPEEQRNCLTVMASVKDMKRHAEMIDYVLFSGKVRLNEDNSVFVLLVDFMILCGFGLTHDLVLLLFSVKKGSIARCCFPSQCPCFDN
jgi:hypothetical protein